jgi:2-oxoglutarate dehydrogenase E2 component (dihydrolipoamide succinyltransferase)
MPTVINMPSLGESVTEGEVGKWLVKEGDRIEKDAPLVEIMTDKADSPVYAPEAGVVTKIFVKEGATVSVGDKLAEIEAGASQSRASSAPKAPEKAPEKASEKAAERASDNAAESGSARAERAPEKPSDRPRAEAKPAAESQDAMASPAIRKLAREQNVDLAKVGGSGTGGRITKDDVLRAADKTDGNGGRAAVPPPSQPREAKGPEPKESRADAPPHAPQSFGPKGAFKLPPYNPVQGDEVVPFSRRRRIIADHMVFSKLTAPHVVTFAECDLHKTAALREAHKNEFKAAGLNLTYLAFVCAATVKALEEFPELNARVLDDAFVKLREINLGIAVDTEEGLVVPVIRHADELSLRGLARAIEELAQKARDGHLVPDDLANKTFTISNPGRKGNLVGGAIISQPNVGILRIGEIKKRVVVVEHEGEDLMAIRPVMHMALSYDHRIVDGVHANGFLWRVNELLEKGEFEI